MIFCNCWGSSCRFFFFFIWLISFCCFCFCVCFSFCKICLCAVSSCTSNTSNSRSYISHCFKICSPFFIFTRNSLGFNFREQHLCFLYMFFYILFLQSFNLCFFLFFVFFDFMIKLPIQIILIWIFLFFGNVFFPSLHFLLRPTISFSIYLFLWHCYFNLSISIRNYWLSWGHRLCVCSVITSTNLLNFSQIS